MNILQYCPAYRPSVGGLEFVVHTLAEQFVNHGHGSRILTAQMGISDDDQHLGVVRAPRLFDHMNAIKWADRIIIHQDCLRLAWAVLGTHKPAIMMVHITPQVRAWPAMLLMRQIARRCRVFAASDSSSFEARKKLNVQCGVLPVPYDTSCFFPPEAGAQRDVDFAFVGRLADGKGVDIFVNALAELKCVGLRPTAVIVGDGEARRQLEVLISRHALATCVKVLGEQSANQIGDILRKTRCLVIPSLYEAFGIVALEGRACGCEVIATTAGGLPDAAGPEAVLVRPGSTSDLAQGMRAVLDRKHAAQSQKFIGRKSEVELLKHQPKRVAEAFLEALGEM